MSINPTSLAPSPGDAAASAQTRDKNTRGAMLYAAQSGNASGGASAAAADIQQTEAAALLESPSHPFLGRNVDIKA